MNVIRSSCTLVAALLLASAPATLLAQDRDAPHGSVVGRVTDASTGAPVVAAQVRLVELHHADLSHVDGRFALLDVAPGTYTLSVERLGYRNVARTVTVTSGAPTEVAIELEVAAVEIGGVVVATGALTARRADAVLSPITTISGAALDRASDQTLAAMLDGRPGLTVTSLGPSTARPVIRGLGGDRIVMLEDGQRTGDLSSLSSDHAVAVEPLTARQIEVVRGPMSLLYGSSAIGGVVNLVREEIPTAAPDELHGMLALQGASVNQGLTGGGWVAGGAGPLALRAEGTYRRFDDLRTPGGRLGNTSGRVRDAAVGVGVPGEHRHVGAAYRFHANDYGIPVAFAGEEVEVSMTRHSLRGEAGLHWGDAFLSSLRLDGGATRYAQDELEEGEVHTAFDQDFLHAQLVARHGARGALREGALGVSAQSREIRTGGELETPSTRDRSWAVFLVEEVGTGPLRFQLGLRYDWVRYEPQDTGSVLVGGEAIPVRERSFGALSGSAGLLWSVSDDVRVGASVGRAYRKRDFNELYTNGPHLAAHSYDVGDPSLEHETGLGYDVFVRFSRESVQGELAAYWNELGDYVFPSSRGRAVESAAGDVPLFQYTNEDARFVGLEGEVLAALTETLRFEASGSLVRARFTSDRAPIPVFDGADTTFVVASSHPPLVPPAQARVGLRVEEPGRFAGFGVKLVGAQNRVGDFETPTSGYALLDVNAGLRIVQGGTLHTITLRVDNVLDREYRDHLSRIKELMPGPGRSVSLLYRWVF